MRNRPAEIGGGVTAAISLLVTKLIGVTDVEVYAALIILVGAMPGGITAIVSWWDRRKTAASIAREQALQSVRRGIDKEVNGNE